MGLNDVCGKQITRIEQPGQSDCIIGSTIEILVGHQVAITCATDGVNHINVPNCTVKGRTHTGGRIGGSYRQLNRGDVIPSSRICIQLEEVGGSTSNKQVYLVSTRNEVCDHISSCCRQACFRSQGRNSCASEPPS